MRKKKGGSGLVKNLFQIVIAGGDPREIWETLWFSSGLHGFTTGIEISLDQSLDAVVNTRLAPVKHFGILPVNMGVVLNLPWVINN